MKVPDFYVGKRFFVGLGIPEIFGRGQKEVRGSAFLEGPQITGDPKQFEQPEPYELGSTMFGQTGNKEMKPTPFYAFLVKTYARIMSYLKVDIMLVAKTIKSKIIYSEVIMAKTKNFVIDHPTKEGKQLVHACLEGPENGVYVRGRLKHRKTIKLPEYWDKLVDPATVTVSLTPIGTHQKLIVRGASGTEVVVQGDPGVPIDCYYHVFAERRDVPKLIIEVNKE